MSQVVLKDQVVYFDGYDLTGDTNAMALEYAAEAVDDTMFGDDTRSAIGGLKAVTFSLQGAVDYSNQGSILFDKVGVSNTVISFGSANTDGTRGYLLGSVQGSYAPGAQVGELYGYSMSGQSRGNLVASTMMATGNKTSSGNGTGRQLGAVSATQKMYASLHILTVSGTTPTLDIDIESDATNSFSGSETTRGSFTQASAIGAELVEISGAITDQYWRVTWTLGGTSPEFDIRLYLGIL